MIQFTSDLYYPQDKASLLLLRKAGNKHHYSFDENTFTKLKDILQLIKLEFTTKKEGYNIVVSSIIYAYRLGYEDVSYFIRFFKKHTGHTPEAYRQNFR